MAFALFVARNKKRPEELCPGSTLCTEFLQNISETEVEVVDCHRSDAPRPAWLKGTPTLYEYETERTWTGHAAVRRLYHMSLHYAIKPSIENAPAPAPSRARPPRVQPPSRPAPAPIGDGGGVDEGDAVEGDMWASQITQEMESESYESETRSDRKMTGDDLNRAMSQRMMSNGSVNNANGDPPQTVNAPPPPPPALHD